VGRALGAAQLGVYAVARQLTNIPLERAMEIINSVTLPAFSLVKHDLGQVRRGYLKVLRLGGGYAFPVFWGLAVVSEPLVRLVLGVKWVSSALVIQLLCVSMPLRMLNSFTSSAVTAIGRQMVNIKSLVLAIVVVPCCVAIGSRWGVQGVAAAWALGFPIVYLFNASLIRRALEIPLAQMFIAVWPSAVAAGVMCVATVTTNVLVLNTLPPLAHVLIAVPFGALIYAGTLWTVSRQSAHEMLEFARGIVSQGA
jgi:O-antigen/teichoic acid export membrane protein